MYSIFDSNQLLGLCSEAHSAGDLAGTNLLRSTVLQQSADFFMRFDVYYESPPHVLMQTRLPWKNRDDVIGKVTSLPLCCMDGAFPELLGI